MPDNRLKRLGNIGLAVLAAGTLGAVTFAVLDGAARPPAAATQQAQQYYDENVVNAKPTLPTSPATKVAFIGDSYTSGSGASVPTLRWSTKLSGAMGWQELNLGIGGTGYFNQGTSTNYGGVIAQAKAEAPAVVVVSGGRNDVGFGAARFAPAVSEFFTALRAELPEAKIVVTSPIYDDQAGPPAVEELDAAVKAAAASVGAAYLDIGEPLLDRPELVSEDGTHPNDAGHAAIEAAVKLAITTVPDIAG